MDDAFERLTQRLEEAMRVEKADIILNIAEMLFGENDPDVIEARKELEES